MAETILHPVPDTKELELQVVNVQQQYGTLVINTDEDILTAKAGLDAVAALREDPVITKLDTAVKNANDLHKLLIDIRKRVTGRLDVIDQFLRKAITAFDDRRAAEAEVRRKALAAENERKHQEQLAAAKLEEEEAAPWEAPAPPPPPPPPPPPVVRAALPTGLSKRKLPPKAVIREFEEKGVFGAGYRALLKETVARMEKGDDSLLRYHLPNQVALNDDAGRWNKEVFEEKVPGVDVVVGSTTVRR